MENTYKKENIKTKISSFLRARPWGRILAGLTAMMFLSTQSMYPNTGANAPQTGINDPAVSQQISQATDPALTDPSLSAASQLTDPTLSMGSFTSVSSDMSAILASSEIGDSDPALLGTGDTSHIGSILDGGSEIPIQDPGLTNSGSSPGPIWSAAGGNPGANPGDNPVTGGLFPESGDRPGPGPADPVRGLINLDELELNEAINLLEIPDPNGGPPTIILVSERPNRQGPPDLDGIPNGGKNGDESGFGKDYVTILDPRDLFGNPDKTTTVVIVEEGKVDVIPSGDEAHPPHDMVPVTPGKEVRVDWGKPPILGDAVPPAPRSDSHVQPGETLPAIPSRDGAIPSDSSDGTPDLPGTNVPNVPTDDGTFDDQGHPGDAVPSEGSQGASRPGRGLTKEHVEGLLKLQAAKQKNGKDRSAKDRPEGSPPDARIEKVRGDVFVRSLSETRWHPAKKGRLLYEHDEVATGKNSFAEIRLGRKNKTARVEMKERSILRLHTLDVSLDEIEKTSYLDLAFGIAKFHVEELQGDSQFEVRTPTATAAVRGTVFRVSVKPVGDFNPKFEFEK